MDCLNQLIKSKFLKNFSSEIIKARNTLQAMEPRGNVLGYFPGKLADRKKIYDRYMNMYEFKASFDDVDVEDVEMVFYLQEDNIVWVASRIKQVIDHSIKESLYTTGDLCIHRSKHFIQNRLFYAAMFDLSFQITPPTVN